MERRRTRPSDEKTISGELGETLKHIQKRYGDNSVSTGDKIYQPDRISTGAFILDFSLLGGIPFSRTAMIVGERHAGKTMLASKIIASAQHQYPDQTPVFIDVEGSYDATWAEKLGVDTSHLIVVPCETGEMVVDIADAVIESKETSLIVIDSIAAMTPMKEVESSAEDAHVGLQARLVGGLIRKLTSNMVKERKRGHFVTVLFLNQFRMKIGVMYGDPRTVPGGKALEFSTSVQITIKNKENTGKDDLGIEAIVKNEHPFTITKNKMNAGPRTGEFMLVRTDDPETGLPAGTIDNSPTLISYAKKFGLYTGGGQSWNLAIGDDSYKFGKAQEAIAMLNEDYSKQRALWNLLIQLQAKRLGMSDEFIERLGNMK
jgi:recombination protein RecA